MDSQQEIQEERYFLPYHYLDIVSNEANLLNMVEYKSRMRRVIEIIKECYSAPINHTTHAKPNQAVGSHEGQRRYPDERSLSRLALISNTPPVAA